MAGGQPAGGGKRNSVWQSRDNGYWRELIVRAVSTLLEVGRWPFYGTKDRVRLLWGGGVPTGVGEPTRMPILTAGKVQ